MFKDNLVKELIKKHESVKFKYRSFIYDLYAEEPEEKKSIYDIKPTSFYDGPNYVDERLAGPDVKLKKKLDLKRIMRESSPDIWDD